MLSSMPTLKGKAVCNGDSAQTSTSQTVPYVANLSPPDHFDYTVLFRVFDCSGLCERHQRAFVHSRLAYIDCEVPEVI